MGGNEPSVAIGEKRGFLDENQASHGAQSKGR